MRTQAPRLIALSALKNGFSEEVNKGLAAPDRGEFVDHDEVRQMIETWYPALMIVRWTKPAVADFAHICDYTENRFGRRKPGAPD